MHRCGRPGVRDARRETVGEHRPSIASRRQAGAVTCLGDEVFARPFNCSRSAYGATVTIAVAVRTQSVVVFATDSKLTARGVAGIADDGTLNWVDQTYDNATKVVHDRRKRLMALAAGNANVGQTNAVDFIASYAFPDCAQPADDERELTAMLDVMNEQKRAFWSQLGAPPNEWPGPTMLIALASAAGPRVWSVSMAGPTYQHREVLGEPNIWLEGSYADVFSLLYGLRPTVVDALGKALGADDAALTAALQSMKVLRPVDQINLATMPLQDAIDLAVFLANVQIEMDRFLPGQPACGGPIDVMVLRMVPSPEILTFPGKALHHPANRGTLR